LSDEQKQKIRELRGRNSGRAKELRESLRAKRNEMRDLMFDPAATEAQIRSARRELRRMQDQMEEMQIDDFLSMRSVLTPEQRKRLPEIMPRPGGGQQQGVGPPQLPASVSDGSSGN
jgi:Spy/CpxP family protein refolding chaperone